MTRISAIAWLTFREGIRMRIVLVFLIVLAVLLLLLPTYLRGDETLAGRLQNFLDYTLGPLGVLSIFLSIATIFFSCATLANEFKDRSLHLVITKPVTRLQILLGKWIGVNLLNILIVALCGLTIYGFAYRIKTLPEQFDRDRYKVRDVVWTARDAAEPVVPSKQIEAQAQKDIDARIRTGEIQPEQRKSALAERSALLYKRWRVIANGDSRQFLFENLAPPTRDDATIQVRFKIVGQPLPMDQLIPVAWVFLDPDNGSPLHDPVLTRERSNDVHQFLVRAAPVIQNGRAVLEVINPLNRQKPLTIVLDGRDSLQVLYKVGIFETNFLKALLLLLLRLALLSAIGVFFSVFVSFPVACLCTSAIFLICLGMPFWLEGIGVGYGAYTNPADDPLWVFGPYLRPVLTFLLRVVFPDFTHYDGGRFLIEGLNISAPLLAQALIHTLFVGIALLIVGWLIFRWREVAEVQV